MAGLSGFGFEFNIPNIFLKDTDPYNIEYKDQLYSIKKTSINKSAFRNITY